MRWQNPDVHARTPELANQLAKEFPDLPNVSSCMRGQFEKTCNEILAFYGDDKDIKLTLDKMRRREKTQDQHLHGVYPSGLLYVVWSLVKRFESYELFKGTLYDMGDTCLQGDSHRLFSTFVALARTPALNNL